MLLYVVFNSANLVCRAQLSAKASPPLSYTNTDTGAGLEWGTQHTLHTQGTKPEAQEP